ncbi:putative kelch-type beta propeller [Arabidopsis thaliana]
MSSPKSSSSESSSPPTSFSSLPFDVALNCWARVSRIHYPTLFLVSKNLRSLIASPELEATRLRIGITEDFVCLDLNKKNPNPSWFILSSTPKQQKLLPIPSFPYQHPKYSTILLVDSLIYIIGGIVNRQRSNRVLILNSLSHQWTADVIDGKLYVIGGSSSKNIEDWGEVYDPKTHTWEPILPTTLDLTAQKSVVQDRLVMGGKVYAMDGLKIELKTNICLVEKCLRLVSYSNHSLYWNDPTEDCVWRLVRGLEELCDHYPYFFNNHNSLANSGGERSVTLWWKSVVIQPPNYHCTKECKTEIWCAGLSFERRGLKELWGFVEWSKNMFTFEECDSRFDFLLH